MALEGTLNYLDIAHLLQVVGTSKKTGTLEISWQERQARLFFENGGLIRAESNRSHDGIGTLLVKAGMLTGEMLDTALQTQTVDPNQRRLGAILCDDLGLPPEALQQMLRRQFEGIVFDVFSWPGGSFVFQFAAPGEVEERFSINPVSFILDVGVQAGLLADEGVDRERADPAQTPVAVLVGNEALAEVCAGTMRRTGHQVLRCERVEELLGFLGQEEEGSRPMALLSLAAVSADNGSQVSGWEVVDRLSSDHPDVPIVLLGTDNDLAALGHHCGGSRMFVRAPTLEDLTSVDRHTHLEVFALRLEKAVHKATAELPPTGEDQDGE